MQKFNDKILVNIVITFLASLIEHFVLPDCSRDVKSKAYITLVRPQLQYACSVWNLYTKRNIHQIELVQYKAARFVFRDYSNFSHVTPMLKQLGWDPSTTQTFVPVINVLWNPTRFSWYLPSIWSMSTNKGFASHNAFPFRHIQSSCNVSKYSFYPSSIEAWNKLPVTTNIFPFTNGIKPKISCMIRFL